MRSITSRLVMLVATAAVLPLVLYGIVAVRSLLAGTRETASQGNLNIALRAAEQVRRYMTTSTDILKAAAADLEGTSLERWQQERILRNYVLAFPEFREITLFDRSGKPIVSSAVTHPQEPPVDLTHLTADVTLSPVVVDDDLLPTTTAVIRIDQVTGPRIWLAGEFDLLELWRMVDGIRVGQEGHALIVAADGRLIAHGDPGQQRRIALGERLGDYPLLVSNHGQLSQARVAELTTDDGTEVLSAAAPIAGLGWTLIVEQPTAEAYSAAFGLLRYLILAITLALTATIVFGYLWSRTFLKPIDALMAGTRAIAEGKFDQRVHIESRDEFKELGDSFNRMTERVIELQEDVRKQERQAVFGRIAAGLVHDLSHPIQNIGNSCKLILKMSDDPDYRSTFKRTVDREFGAIRRVLEGLRNLARPIPLERFPIDLNRSVEEVVESMEPQARIAGVTLHTQLAPQAPKIEGDLFALSRVYRNLITNALQATPPDGRVTLSTRLDDGQATIDVSDTGCGIPPEKIEAIFEDFATTKRRGLGLGLAVCKKIVEQLSGTIRVASEVGRGSTFSLTFPALRLEAPRDMPTTTRLETNHAAPAGRASRSPSGPAS